MARLFLVFLRLGLTSFGGPIAHIGAFRGEMIQKRGWMSDAEFGEIVGLCQMLPGPTSSQVGLLIGLHRAGARGAAVAWLGFTLPSALLMIGFGMWCVRHRQPLPAAVLHGLNLCALAVVGQALWSMGKNLCADWRRRGLAAAVALASLWFASPWSGLALILVSGALGALFAAAEPEPPTTEPAWTVPAAVARGALLVLGALLLALPVLAGLLHAPGLATFGGFFRVGALVFGGGHVVLPLLDALVVPSGAVSSETFLAGYGAAQALPGPLFTFAGFLGTVASAPTGGPAVGPAGGPGGGLLALLAIFAPSFLLIGAAQPIWLSVHRRASMRRALSGINAGVVGLLLASWLDPVAVKTLCTPADALIALAGLLALVYWRWPPWLVMLASLALALAISLPQLW